MDIEMVHNHEMEPSVERIGDRMNQMTKVFENQQFGKIRVVMQEGEPWFVAVDVCNALELTNSRITVGRLDDDEKGVSSIYTPGGTQNMVVINESGLYTLVLGSRKPEAKQFKRWITHEVIPTIRKHGAYMTDSVLEQVMSHPEMIYSMAEQLIKEKSDHEKTKKELEVAQPKAIYFDHFVNAWDMTNIRKTAVELGIPQNRFVAYLLKHHYLYRERTQYGRLLPRVDMNRGYFVVKDFYSNCGQLWQQTFVTCKGKEHFRKKIAKILEETA